MSGENSYVFEISGGNSHTIQQVPSRKRMQIRHSFSDEKKPPVIQIGKTEERMEIRQSFGANGKMNARGFAIRSQTKKTASRREARRLPAANSRRPTPDGPRENTRCGTGHHKAHEHLPAARHRTECRMHRRSEASQQMAGRSLSPPGASATRTPSPHGEARDSK